ncbi:NAD(P)-dependent oxidoreductase [Agrobacterium rubi]|uniref:NAD(P)-dependent oxidoreductase n=1 Tax=Agrobacterium rubi TaxID=28099 RepID=UPI001571DDEE|nr:NAD(P)-dependent oxidoreductase [Agrobacterium rubi]NTF08918.1 NAD(P)-dependent oxidoreductase [Agrobacterium rubi]NTF21189.1 NAD(P)-dependent oxidoreductase [Agrobacterium rubi]NTF28046.1 NAD(P)-dependent oxidoreductase [Agrobacterium rubi]
MRTCFIGFGEVGRIYAQAFSDAGIVVDFVCDAHFTDVGKAAAEQLKAKTMDSVGSWLAECDIVVSAVTGGVALDVVRSALPHMKKDALFIDLTTASPDAMQEAGKLAAQSGQSFADVGVLGAVSIKKGATALVVAGSGAQAFAPIAERLGAKLKILPGEAGDAVRLKLLRSVFTKGLEALAVETLVAAEMQNLRGEFYDIITDIDDTPLQQFLEVLVRTHVVHAKRRGHEVQEASVQLDRLGISPLVTSGVQSLFHRTTDRTRAFEEPPTIEAALSWLSESDGRKARKAQA